MIYFQIIIMHFVPKIESLQYQEIGLEEEEERGMLIVLTREEED